MHEYMWTGNLKASIAFKLPLSIYSCLYLDHLSTSVGHIENGNPNSNQEAKLFFNKILKIYQKDTHNIFKWTSPFTSQEEFERCPLSLGII